MGLAFKGREYVGEMAASLRDWGDLSPWWLLIIIVIGVLCVCFCCCFSFTAHRTRKLGTVFRSHAVPFMTFHSSNLHHSPPLNAVLLSKITPEVCNHNGWNYLQAKDTNPVSASSMCLIYHKQIVSYSVRYATSTAVFQVSNLPWFFL